MSHANNELINARRESVRRSFEAAQASNRLRFLAGDPRASEQYVWPNQIMDATVVVDTLIKNPEISLFGITKQPQVGMAGLLHYIPYLFCTHPDDAVVMDPAKCCVLTGMSNLDWETDTKNDFPECFRDQIFHHGKLAQALPILRKIAAEGGNVIIDEIQNGAQEKQVLHQVLREAGLLDIEVLESKRVKIIAASATMIKHIHDASRWGGKAYTYPMTIPDSYMGFEHLKAVPGVLREWKDMKTIEKTREWFDEIEAYYPGEFRVHVVRANTAKMLTNISQVVLERGYGMIPHTSKEKLTEVQKKMLFEDPLIQHWIIPVKNLWRAANRIPRKYKLRIGSVHEQWVKKVDNDVQAQGLPGRMLGYNNYPEGHKFGPYYTSLKAIDQYIAYTKDPLSPENAYQCRGFKRSSDGTVTSTERSIVSARNIANLNPSAGNRSPNFTTHSKWFAVFQRAEWAKEYAQMLGYQWNEAVIMERRPEEFGEFIVTGLNARKCVCTVYEVVNAVTSAYGNVNGERAYRTCLAGYMNKEEIDTAMFVVIIRPNDHNNEGRMAIINERFRGRRVGLDKWQPGRVVPL